MTTFERTLELPIARDLLFDWHERPGAFDRLSPSWERIEVNDRGGGIRDGGFIRMTMHRGPFHVEWLARHHGYVWPEKFEDEAERGPFAHWHHVHAFSDTSSQSSGPGVRLHDRVEYRLPLSPISGMLAGRYVDHQLQRMFRQRHVRTANDLRRHLLEPPSLPPMRVGVTGASGLLGSALTAFLQTGGHTVVPFVRKDSSTGIIWNHTTRDIDRRAIEALDVIVHLAGESVDGRWTPEKKQRILSSRADGTRFLCETIAERSRKPHTLICASAVGIYGDTGDRWVDESSAVDGVPGFLPEVCRAWEDATAPAREAGVRVVNIRIGVVMSPRGGALGKLLLPASLGLGGPIAGGQQYMPWIDADDLLGVVLHAMRNTKLEGPVNAVAPEPVTQRAFAKTLGKVLHRPAFMPLPGPVISTMFGQMGREVLLAGQRARPTKLLESGFRFDFPSLEGCLRHELGRVGDDAVAKAVRAFEQARAAAT